MSTDTILGINPGTRFVSVAVLRNGALVRYQVRSFQGVWSSTKLKTILFWLDGIIGRYGISKIAVKIPDKFPTSPCYLQLIGSFNVLCESKGMKASYYSFSEVTAHHSVENQDKAALMHSIVGRHPELLPEYRKEQRNSNAHYYKLFEAIAAAHMQ